MIHFPIAIVGGGPAGALAGELLAASGKKVLLFDEKLAWEKPCGGGLTHKALAQYPFLSEARTDSNFIRQCELRSPSGRSARFELRHPLAIFSRLELNGLLLERARRSGAQLRKERVTKVAGENGAWQLTTTYGEYRAGHLVLAAGARNPFRAQFLSAISPDDLMVTAGYFIPGQSSLVQIQFLKEITGYIWVFPRPDHLSAGIAAKMGETTTAELRRRLELWLGENHFNLEGARFYSHILPAFRSQTLEEMEVCGDGWTMIGDSAGLVDPITGEGLYYALRSAELCAGALLAGDPTQYRVQLGEEVISELKLAARVSQRFYTGQIFGESILERMVALTEQSESIRGLMSDLFAGMQSYRDLRSRLLRAIPSLMLSGLNGSMRLPSRRAPLSNYS
ncbi:MAG: NAD(P)/FAD-dependent oxidoreductase [Acidobacteria bacterium]|jgi:flavin-dependent dehydrogenase|nr:MAG: NAD(P)/FAD-dependent oxidoreductase [Acidobacteriota bacterium]